MSSLKSNLSNLESQLNTMNASIEILVLQASRQSFFDSTHYSVLGFLHKNANARSADYIEEHMGKALFFFTREELWNHTLGLHGIDGLIVEFGVADGYSINHIAKRVNQTVYGFDSFEGLPSDWPGASLQKGHFNRNGKLPEVEPNVTLIAGEFNQTINLFKSKNAQAIRLMHIDSDLYSSCKAIFDKLDKQIVCGTLIIFDEYLGFPGWEFGEFLAFKEFVVQKELSYEYVSFSQNQAVVRIL